jgi:hypothetical protein
VRRSLRRKWPVYILIGAACLSLGAAFFLPEVVPIGWHILHGKSAQFHQWDIPVPWGWWAFREQGQVILQKMRRPVDRDSEVIFDEPLPADREPYGYDKQKYSLAEHMLKEGYRLTEERRTRLAGEVSVQSRKRSMHPCHADPCATFSPTET